MSKKTTIKNGTLLNRIVFLNFSTVKIDTIPHTKYVGLVKNLQMRRITVRKEKNTDLHRYTLHNVKQKEINRFSTNRK